MKYLEYIPKNHPYIEFMGTLDEAESALGLAISLFNKEDDIKRDITWIQDLLFRIGFTVTGKNCVSDQDLLKLERKIDEYSRNIEPVFTLNGGHPASAAISLARAMVRRVERRFVDLVERKEIINKQKLMQALLNRISDTLYTLQLTVNLEYGYENKRVSCS